MLQWVNNLVPFKAACEEIYIKQKMYKRHKTPMQIKVMFDNFSGTRKGWRRVLFGGNLSSMYPLMLPALQLSCDAITLRQATPYWGACKRHSVACRAS